MNIIISIFINGILISVIVVITDGMICTYKMQKIINTFFFSWLNASENTDKESNMMLHFLKRRNLKMNKLANVVIKKTTFSLKLF